jgi:pimeloyl-ACP methyl ester carboxylesterase
MKRILGWAGLSLMLAAAAHAQIAQRVVDIPTRPGVTQRFLLIDPGNPKAAVILFPGARGGLRMLPSGRIQQLGSDFLVRARSMFAAHGLLVALIDAPSDRQHAPYLYGFRQTPRHMADIKAVIAWLKKYANVPVWLVGTSRGTQSAAFVTTQLPPAEGGPDGLVLTSTILVDKLARPVLEMPLQRITIPVLVVHHKRDGCAQCPYAELPRLMDRLSASPRKELITVDGGQSHGEACEGFAYHSFNGIQAEVVGKIARWIEAN